MPIPRSAFVIALILLMCAANPSMAQTQEVGDADIDPSESVQIQDNLTALQLSARLTDGGQIIDNGLKWRILSNRPDANGNYRLIKETEDSITAMNLVSGKYIVQAIYGYAVAMKEIELTGEPASEIMNLDAGALSVTAIHPGGIVIRNGLAKISVYSFEKDNFGQRKLIATTNQSSITIPLNASTYNIVSQYGKANSIVRYDATVRAGKLNEISITHSASRVTFKLVTQLGGEAIANTSWSILTPDGEEIAESIGAFPSQILAEGTYSVVARSEGRAYSKEFSVTAGRDQEVEILITQ